MPEVTLDSLAARLAVVERELAALRGVTLPSRDWRGVVGISEETEFSRLMQAEMKAIKEAEWLAAQNGTEE